MAHLKLILKCFCFLLCFLQFLQRVLGAEVADAGAAGAGVARVDAGVTGEGDAGVAGAGVSRADAGVAGEGDAGVAGAGVARADVGVAATDAARDAVSIKIRFSRRNNIMPEKIMVIISVSFALKARKRSSKSRIGNEWEFTFFTDFLGSGVADAGAAGAGVTRGEGELGVADEDAKTGVSFLIF